MSNVFLNEDKIPFLKLRSEDMKVLVDNIENLHILDNGTDSWVEKTVHNAISMNSIYRTRPQKDSFDWPPIAPEWKHLRRDESGQVFLYVAKPVLGSTQWNSIDGFAVNITGLSSSYKNNGMPWNEMILDRPESEKTNE